MKYRPWGSIDWVLSLSNPKQWAFMGVVGTEERSLCSWEHVRQQGLISKQLLVQIKDVYSIKYDDQTTNALTARRKKLSDLGENVEDVLIIDLMAALFQVKAFAIEFAKENSSVILDITSFPKRFFFPILEILVQSNIVRNLIITYTSPDVYASESLYEDIEEWRVLPGFGGSGDKPELWVASIGFLVESLAKYVGGNPDEKMIALVPFPAPLAILKRTWESVSKLELSLREDRFEKYRVETLDISAAFDRICSLTCKPEKTVAFAPFGPKPTSAAMCLYAMQRPSSSSVHYAQPTVYHPEYTSGICHNDSSVAINAYWIKHEGAFLYEI